MNKNLTKHEKIPNPMHQNYLNERIYSINLVKMKFRLHRGKRGTLFSSEGKLTLSRAYQRCITYRY